MRPGALVFLVLVMVLGSWAPARAADPVPTTLTLSAPARYADLDTPVQVELLADGAPHAGAEVLLQRRVDGVWGDVALLVTDDAGQAVSNQTLARDGADNVFRATYAGDDTYAPAASGAVTVPLLRRTGVVRVLGPDTVVDEQSVVLTVRWRTANGLPVNGRVVLWRRVGGGDWKVAARLTTGADGRAERTVAPRRDTRWRAVARGLDWVTGDRSPVHRLDNLPPGIPVRLPKGAPSPRIDLPDQRRAVGAGPHPVISRIPDGVWNQMTGRSWHRGCPVGRAGLRLLRINYWDYSGYRRRGELVARADAVGRMKSALAAMYRRDLPIRSMYRVDRFGWSEKLQGADDYRSMAAGNTSAFNCRWVVGRPGVRSPHAYGRALDLNTWENPYRSSGGWVPNRWWVGRSHPRVAWRSRSHAVVSLMIGHGFRWTYGVNDAQHFDAPAPSGRVLYAARGH